MTTENTSPSSPLPPAKSHHRRQKAKKNSEPISPIHANDWSEQWPPASRLAASPRGLSGISFCIVGSACSNQRLLSALEDRYVYECIDDERQAIRTLAETKALLAQRQLRIYVIDSFDDCIFQCIKENEDVYAISSELVLSCAEKEIVRRSRTPLSNMHDCSLFQDIPVPRKNRPLYCQHLSAAVICFVGIRRDTHVGGSTTGHFSDGRCWDLDGIQ